MSAPVDRYHGPMGITVCATRERVITGLIRPCAGFVGPSHGDLNPRGVVVDVRAAIVVDLALDASQQCAKVSKGRNARHGSEPRAPCQETGDGADRGEHETNETGGEIEGGKGVHLSDTFRGLALNCAG